MGFPEMISEKCLGPGSLPSHRLAGRVSTSFKGMTQPRCLTEEGLVEPNRAWTKGTRRRRTMSKKLVLALFALATVLAITPAATADTYTFSYTGSVFSAQLALLR